MKLKFILSITLTTIFTTSFVAAQEVVEDPASIAQNAASQIVNLAKYVQMVENQVQQIETMTQELNQVSAYVKAFGDPSQTLNISGATSLTTSLQQPGIGQSISLMQQNASGSQSLSNNGNGLYPTINNTALTGIAVSHDQAAYKPFSAVENATANYANVESDVAKKREALKSQIAATVNQLQSATTDAQTQKLQGVLTAQSAQLHALDQEISQAASKTVVQEIANKNNQQKQQQAQQDEIEADRQDALTKFGTMMTPDTTDTLHFGTNP